MTNHASALELDEAAAGLGSAEVRAHVEGCPDCKSRLAQAAASREEVMRDPRFRQTFAKLPAARAPRRWIWLLAPAAAAVLLIVLRPSPALRAKGSASIELRSASGHDPSAPHVGDSLELRLASGGHRYAVALAIDQAGKATVLWPSGGERSGALSPGEHASVLLRVTPGAVRIIAAFSDQPLTLDDVIARRPGEGVEFQEKEVRPVP
jgi:hypothetical protein